MGLPTPVKWVITDGTATYTFEINPAQGKANAELDYKKNVVYQTQGDGGPMANLGQNPIFECTMEGSSLTQSQYTQLWFWYNDTTIVTITDDLGRVYQGYITDYQPKRVRKPDFQYRMDWSVKFLVFTVNDVLSGTLYNTPLGYDPNLTYGGN
jgi:hypothetical protein